MTFEPAPHQLGVQEVARLAADLRDALVLLPPADGGYVRGRGQEPPGRRVQLAELVNQPLGGTEHLRVDIKLPLGPGAVVDAVRAAAPPTGQVSGSLIVGESASSSMVTGTFRVSRSCSA